MVYRPPAMDGNEQASTCQTLEDYLGNHYILAGIFKCGGITGFSWYIYHNQNRERHH